MSAATISEQVVGLPLYVPMANNFFSVNSGGMPNGDDCLNVLGLSGSSQMLALQRCPTAGQLGMIFTDTMTVGEEYSMTFWINVPVTGTYSGKLFSCKDWQGVYTTGSVGGGGSSSDRWWIELIGAGGANYTMQFRRRQSRDGIHTRTLSSISHGTWHMITFNIAYGGAVNVLQMDAYIDDDAVGTTGNVTVSGAFSTGLRGIPHFAIGGYISGFDGVNIDYELGKMTYWDHMLSLAERQTLYAAVMDPCA